MAKYDKADIERRMKGAVESLKGDLSGLRTGRANTSLLDPVVVEVYGAMMPLNQVATVSAPDPRMLSVQVWDKTNLTAVEKGIAKANLGLNPMIDGQTLRLPMPDLTEERRRDLAKLAGQYAEQAKIAIRNVRRDGMEALKEDEKKKEISEDDRKRSEDDVQKLTDKYVAETDAAAQAKDKEILTQYGSGRSFRDERGRAARTARCHHHGWQWPLGKAAPFAARLGASARRGGGAQIAARD